jgi:ubiquitin carboxyl-terminal hydrolase 4/11/15
MLDEFDNTTLQEGQKVYIVSNRWLARVQARGSGAKVIEEDTESEIGPVDNTDIIQETLTNQDGLQFVRLKPGLSLQEYTQFPRPAWDTVVSWYGLQPRQIAIERTVIDTSLDPNGMPQTIVEMNPIVITVHRLWGSHSPLPIPSILKSRDPLAPVFIVSQTDRFMNLLKKIKIAASIDLPQIVRLWRVSRIVDGMDTISVPGSRANTPAPDAKSKEETWARLLLDVKSFLDLERGVQRELLDVKDQTNKNFNGSSTVGMIFGGADNDLVLDELVEAGSYLTDYVAPKNTKNVALTTVNRASASKTNSGRNSPSLLGPVTRGRSQKSGKPLGAVGLVNLGNSCYMNSALQCIRNCEELTKFFLAGEAEKELNTTNHLGSYGAVAIAYHNLLREIYKDPPPSAYAPRGFKNAMSKYDPTYSNYSQQDSQEFLGSFLSCLQEDLGRIETKPYIEKPDSTDEIVASEDSIKKFAAQIWENHKKRDDSAITDLFTGMYKSTLVCPVCAKVSVTFDPFTTLSIPLAIENTWTHDVFYFPLNDYPTRISIDIEKQGTIRTMKEFISDRVGVPPENLFVAEEWKNRFFKFFEDSKLVAEEIQSSDHIAVYELEAAPTNWPAPKKKTKKFKSSLNFSSYNNDSEEDEIPGWDDPMAERMVVPVYHRQPNVSTGYGRAKPWVFAPVPHFIVLTPAEARNEDIIRRKVLEKVKTFTTYELDGDNDIEVSDDDEDQRNVDGDIVLTTASDADSSGDGKVVATSVDGEDDVVDVTMKDSTNIRESVEADSNVDHKRSAYVQKSP